MQLPQLIRIRWAVRAALILGVAASVAANVLHAQPNIISQLISAWPPLALLLTIELTSRIPMHKPLLAAVRVSATITIAGIAAWVSYWHMKDVAVRFGETQVSSYLLPISVDGLIIVASVSLVELAGRIRLVEERRLRAAFDAANPAPTPVPSPAVAPVSFVPPAVAQPVTAPLSAPAFQPASPEPLVAAATGWSDESATLSDDDPRSSAQPLTAAPVSPAVVTTRPTPYVNGSSNGRGSAARPATSAPARKVVTAATTPAAESKTPKQRRPRRETADLAKEIERMYPGISPNEVAERIGTSPDNLRAAKKLARDDQQAAAAMT